MLEAVDVAKCNISGHIPKVFNEFFTNVLKVLHT